jgi:hypothetical protein
MIGKTELVTDFNLANPMDSKNSTPLCGLLTFCQWNKQPGGVLLLEGRLSGNNQGAYQDAVDSREKTPECEFKIDWYKWDEETDAYYKCFHTDDTPIKARLSEDHASTVEDELATEYKQIRNHKFVLALLGTDKEDMFLQIAYNLMKKKPFQFGQKCGA